MSGFQPPVVRASSASSAALRAHLETLPLARAFLAELSAHRAQRVVDVAAARLKGITVVMENLVDVHNASAVLRTCEGLGVDAIHVVQQPNKWEKNKAISRSADDWISVHKYDGLSRCLGDLTASGFTLYAADVGAGCVSVADIDVDVPVCLVFGSEHSGLSKRAKALVDQRFTIPMHGMVESFNVSVSAAVALWEVTARRRRALGGASDLTLDEQTARAMKFLRRAIKAPEIIAHIEARVAADTDTAADAASNDAGEPPS